jgi:hypothetical protein
MYYPNQYPPPRPPQYPAINWALYPNPYNRRALGHIPQVKEAVTFIKTVGHPASWVDIRTTAGRPVGQYPDYDPYFAGGGADPYGIEKEHQEILRKYGVQTQPRHPYIPPPQQPTAPPPAGPAPTQPTAPPPAGPAPYGLPPLPKEDKGSDIVLWGLVGAAIILGLLGFGKVEKYKTTLRKRRRRRR